jgi:hypothetical protein
MSHSDAVLLIGPLPPLLPRTLRFRLRMGVVASAAVVFGMVVLAAIVLTVQSDVVRGPALAAFNRVLPNLVPGPDARGDTVPVFIVTRPVGAAIVLDDRELGRTPLVVNIRRDRLVRLQLDGFLDGFVRASATTVDVPLWQAQPDVRIVRPPVPGAGIRSAGFLPDGRVSLDIEVPPSGERQAWAYDTTAARMDRLGQAEATGAAFPSAVATAPDGLHTASILHLDGLDGAAADQLALEGPEGPSQPLPSALLGERLIDLSWSPTTSGLLLVSQRPVARGTSFHVRFVGSGGPVRDLVDLPRAPVSGSWVWAPDGGAVAFLVQSTMALATLDMSSGELRYVDDLQPDAFPSNGAVAPATWTPTGELLYAAPARTLRFSVGSSTSAAVLFGVAPGRLDAHRLGDVEPVWAPIVRDDGIILTLARADNDELVLRPVDPAGHALAEQRLGVHVSGAFAARWDLRDRQILIMRGASGGGIDVLLLRFGAADLRTVPAGANTSPEGASR